MTRWGTKPTGGAIVSVSCTPEQKVSWDALVDQLGFRSISAMVRYAVEQLILTEMQRVGSESTEGAP